MTGTLLRKDVRTAATRTRARGQLDRRALGCLVLGLLALVAVFAAVLSHRIDHRAGTNGVWPVFPAGTLGPGQRLCQDEELVPAGAAEIRVVLQPMQAVGPRIAVTLTREGRTVGRTVLVPKLRDELLAIAPLRPSARELDDVQVCLAVIGHGRVGLVGGPTPPGNGQMVLDGRPLGASMPISYLDGERASWWSRAHAVADRMALGRGDWARPPRGGWIPWATGALVLAALALTVLALVRGVIAPRGSWRLAAGAVAAVAVLNAVAWSLITPAFQVPDEQTHLGYAQQLAETGRPPVARRGDERLAPELVAAMESARFGELGTRTYAAAVWSRSQQRQLDAVLHAGLARRSENDTAGPAAPEPPLYYALEAIPYRLASGATLLDRLALMRLWSALLAGVTALFAFLFLRACLPGHPWTWTVGALGAALHPLLGFVSGGVNPDALLFAICAALFHALAVAFRDGLTTRRAAWVGALLALGIVGKINFYGLVPGALLAVTLTARASAGGLNVRALRLVGVVVGIAVVPYLLLTLLDALAWERSWILARTPAERPEDHGGIGGQLSYLWQVFLPRLPGQSTAFPDFYPGWQLWLKGFLGRFGWTVVSFADWVYRLAAALLAVAVALALRVAVRERATLRRRLGELAGYATMAGGLLLLIALVALRGFAPGVQGAIQGRYLMPLLALFAALLALAARGAGARWGRAAGVAIVLVCVAWSLLGQLSTIAWFYG